MIIFDKKVANILFISSSDFFLLSHFVTSIVHKHHETLGAMVLEILGLLLRHPRGSSLLVVKQLIFFI
jgi:hypothetical protein